MMAYVAVKVSPGKENEVAGEIVKTEGVTEAAWTYGFCDILFKLEVESTQELNNAVLKKVRKIPGVLATETIIVSPIPIYATRPANKTRATRLNRKGT